MSDQPGQLLPDTGRSRPLHHRVADRISAQRPRADVGSCRARTDGKCRPHDSLLGELTSVIFVAPGGRPLSYGRLREPVVEADGAESRAALRDQGALADLGAEVPRVRIRDDL